jgi:hypothetical protein
MAGTPLSIAADAGEEDADGQSKSVNFSAGVSGNRVTKDPQTVFPWGRQPMRTRVFRPTAQNALLVLCLRRARGRQHSFAPHIAVAFGQC